MAVSEVERILSEAAAEVLETMFFTSLAEGGEPAPRAAEPCICAQLSFGGVRAGHLGVRVSLETAREIAANFLGLDGQQLSHTQIDDVICELSNMVCGLLLGRMDSSGVFELSKAQIGPREAGCPRGNQATCRTVVLEGGVMEVWLEWESPQ